MTETDSAQPLPPSAPPQAQGPAPAQTAGLEFNRPTIVSLLYLAGLLTALPTLLAVILAYVWRNEPMEPWEESHYRYHIRSFWIGLLYALVACMLMIVGIGFLILGVIPLWLGIRTIIALAAAQRREPVRNAESWIW